MCALRVQIFPSVIKLISAARYGDCVAANVYYVYVVKGQQLLSRVNKEKMESNRSERRKGALKQKADGGHGQRTLL